MSETTTLTEEKKPETPIDKNPFDESSWDSATTEVKDTTTVQSKEPGAEAVSPEVVDEDVFLNTYFQREFGSDPTAAKAEWEALRKLKDQPQTPAERKFANEESKRFVEAMEAGKIDEAFSMYNQQKQLERLEKLELTKIEDAAEVIKANLQFKHKDLSPKEIEFLYNKRYSIPKQPSQLLDEDGDDYAQRIESWKSEVQEKEQEILIEAKLARPEFAKYKSELVFPDIQKAIPQQQEPDQKSLEAIEAGRNKFLTQLEAGYKTFNGFETKVKDELVEIPIAFNVPDEERTAYYNKLKEFDINSYFDSRWFDKEGNANVSQMMSDLYLLENPGKVFEGVANNSASKRLDEYLKAKSNIKVDGTPQGTFQPDSKDAKQKEADTIWDS